MMTSSWGKIRQGLARDREHLAGDMEALTHKVKLPALKHYLHQSRETLRDKAGETSLQAKSLVHRARAQLPAPATGRISQLTQTVRRRPVPAVAVMLGPVIVLVLRALLRRTR
jgi:hypothetical protein